MKIAVIGAGVIGTTTAYELGTQGHEVHVFERRGAVAEETSFGNAGVVAPGYVTPWAAPGMVWKILAQSFHRHAAFRFATPLSSQDLAWGWRFFRACKPETYTQHRLALQALAFYSRTRWHDLSESLSLEHERSQGYMVLLRSEKELAMVQPGLNMLKELGVAHKVLDETQARAIEFALNQDTALHAAIHLPDDEVANCRQFSLALKDEARKRGVQFHFGVNALPPNPWNPAQLQLTHAQSGSALSAPTRFDAVVLCAGVAAAQWLQACQISIPMRPIYGYSITATIKEPLHAPRSGVMDERYKVAISRLGQRVRVAGSAQLGGRLDRQKDAALQTLYKVLHDWYPGAAQLGASVQHWMGARPMLADRPPIIGPTPLPGLWLNLGHGSSGWALSCGSARLLADQMAGRAAEINPSPYQLTP